MSSFDTALLAGSRGPSLGRLTGLELRKSVDTRSGRVLLGVVLVLGVAALGYELTQADGSPVGLEDYLGTALQGVLLVLPVIGVMAMTAEWTQRTALSTFTLVPHRGRVLTAKVLAGLVLAAVMVVVVVGLTGATMVAAGLRSGVTPSWDDAGALLTGALLASLLQVLMAAGFGALIPETAAAVSLFLIAPNLWTNAGPALFGERADWVDVFGAINRVATLDAGHLDRTVSSLVIWIGVPLVVGIGTSLRREVK